MQEKKTLIFTRPHKKIYATEDKIIKVFDNNYKKSDVLNEARNEALVEENTDLNVPSLSAVSKTEEGWALTREKVEGTTLDLKSDEDEAVYTFDTSIMDQGIISHPKSLIEGSLI